MKLIDIGAAGTCFALAASLAGCGGFSLSSLNPWSGSTERTRTAPADATVYQCSDAKRLTVRYLAGTNSAMIVFREREFRLDQAASAPGRYTNGSTTLLSKGEETSLEEEGAVTYANCRRAAG